MYSVIIPAYNAEVYIGECIQSVLRQTVDDFEIIVVDDSSVDATASIVQCMTEVNSKIKLVKHDKNKGELLARKTGVEFAKGEYCLFLDADDALAENALESINLILMKNLYDIISFGVRLCVEDDVDEEHLRSAYAYFVPYQGELRGRRIFEECFENHVYPYNVWDKVYRAELCKKGFSHITEQYNGIGADIYTYFVLSFLAETFLGVKDELYEYHVGRGVTGKQNMGLDKFEMHCKQIYIADACAAFLQKFNMIDAYEGVVQRLREDALMDCLGCFRRNISENDVSEALKLLYRYWGNEVINKQIRSQLRQQAGEIRKLQVYIGELSVYIEKISAYVKKLESVAAEKCWKFPYDRIPKNSQIVIYGAGKVGRDYVKQIKQTQWGKIVLWVDQGKKGECVDEISISDMMGIMGIKYDYLVIAIFDTETRRDVKEQLISMGISSKVIVG